MEICSSLLNLCLGCCLAVLAPVLPNRQTGWQGCNNSTRCSTQAAVHQPPSPWDIPGLPLLPPFLLSLMLPPPPLLPAKVLEGWGLGVGISFRQFKRPWRGLVTGLHSALGRKKQRTAQVEGRKRTAQSFPGQALLGETRAQDPARAAAQ